MVLWFRNYREDIDNIVNIFTNDLISKKKITSKVYSHKFIKLEKIDSKTWSFHHNNRKVIFQFELYFKENKLVMINFHIKSENERNGNGTECLDILLLIKINLAKKLNLKQVISIFNVTGTFHILYRAENWIQKLRYIKIPKTIPQQWQKVYSIN